MDELEGLAVERRLGKLSEASMKEIVVIEDGIIT